MSSFVALYRKIDPAPLRSVLLLQIEAYVHTSFFILPARGSGSVGVDVDFVVYGFQIKPLEAGLLVSEIKLINTSHALHSAADWGGSIAQQTALVTLNQRLHGTGSRASLFTERQAAMEKRLWMAE